MISYIGAGFAPGNAGNNNIIETGSLGSPTAYSQWAHDIHFRGIWFFNDWKSLAVGTNNPTSDIAMNSCLYCSLVGSYGSQAIRLGAEGDAIKPNGNSLKIANTRIRGFSSSMLEGGQGNTRGFDFLGATDFQVGRFVGEFPYSWMGGQLSGYILGSVTTASTITFAKNDVLKQNVTGATTPVEVKYTCTAANSPCTVPISIGVVTGTPDSTDAWVDQSHLTQIFVPCGSGTCVTALLGLPVVANPTNPNFTFLRKNMIEFKEGKGIVVYGSIFKHNNNTGGQNGTAMTIDPRNTSGTLNGATLGQNYNVFLGDIRFENNLYFDSCEGTSHNARGLGVSGTTYSSQRELYNNLLYWGMSGTVPGCNFETVGITYDNGHNSYNVTMQENSAGTAATATAFASVDAGVQFSSSTLATTCPTGVAGNCTTYNSVSSTIASNGFACGEVNLSSLGVGDAHITSGTNSLTSASGNFFPQMNGITIYVSGAGAAGAYLTAVATYVSPTALTLSVNASTTVTTGIVFLQYNLFVTGFSNAVNNSSLAGFQCVGSTASTLVLVNPSGIAETPGVVNTAACAASKGPCANSLINNTNGLGFQVLDMLPGDPVSILASVYSGTTPSNCVSGFGGATGTFSPAPAQLQVVSGNTIPISAGPLATVGSQRWNQATNVWTLANSQVTFPWTAPSNSADNSGQCVLINIEGGPKNVTLTHNGYVGDANEPLGQGPLPSNGPTFMQNAAWLDSYFFGNVATGKGWSNTALGAGEGNATEVFQSDFSTMSAWGLAFPSRFNPPYTEFGNNPLFPDPLHGGCTGVGCTPPFGDTFFFPTDTCNAIGFNYPGCTIGTPGTPSIPLFAADYRWYAPVSGSPFFHAAPDDNTKDIGPIIANFAAGGGSINGQTQNLYVCATTCPGPGPFPDYAVFVAVGTGQITFSGQQSNTGNTDIK